MNLGEQGSGGERGIRTLGTFARSTVFETAPFDHSGTSPGHDHSSFKMHDFKDIMKLVSSLIYPYWA